MSPASRSKPKDKKSGKEPPKGSSKSSGHVNSSSGTPASGYNPLLGTFTTLETAPVPSVSSLHVNGRFRNIDDTDDHNGNSSGTGNDYDSVSNNGSWSGESEDHKEKASPTLSRPESVPGSDNDKREKIRQKNERKHQRQKERRAQELHERCSGYLMSRKLEALAQQLVGMGFSQERATMALILNEGRVEESVAWLLEAGEDDNNKQRENHNLGSGNLKIDISEELAKITQMEVRYKSSKQEVERAVVSCEGDLEKAEETLKAQKEEPPAATSKQEEIVDPPAVANSSKTPIANSQNPIRIQTKSTPSTTVIQQHRHDRDFNYTRAPPTVVGSSVDPGAKSMQLLKKTIPPKSDWAKPQPQISIPAEKRGAVASAGPNRSAPFPMTSPSLTSPSPAKTEAHYVGNELKNLQLGSVKESVVVMQRPQYVTNMKQSPSGTLSSSPPPPPGTAAMMGGWYPNSGEMVKPNGFVPPVTVSRSFNANGVNSNPLQNHQFQQHQYMSSNSSSSSMDSLGTNTSSNRGNGLWSRGGALGPITAAASLGLFSGYSSSNSTNGSSGSSPRVDWSTGNSTTPEFDYRTVDWSLDLGREASSFSKLNKGWGGALSYPPMQNDARIYDSYAYGLSVKSGMRPVLGSNGGGGGAATAVVAGVPASGDGAGAGAGSRDWSSPFEEKDIFSLPRQFVSSPSL